MSRLLEITVGGAISLPVPRPFIFLFLVLPFLTPFSLPFLSFLFPHFFFLFPLLPLPSS